MTFILGKSSHTFFIPSGLAICAQKATPTTGQDPPSSEKRVKSEEEKKEVTNKVEEHDVLLWHLVLEQDLDGLDDRPARSKLPRRPQEMNGSGSRQNEVRP